MFSFLHYLHEYSDICHIGGYIFMSPHLKTLLPVSQMGLNIVLKLLIDLKALASNQGRDENPVGAV